MLTTKFENIKMHENQNFSSFYFELSDIVNLSFNLGEPILDSKVVRKILRSVQERFRPKVTVIKERDFDIVNVVIDSMKVDELFGFIQTYEMTLPSSQKPKDIAFKAFENQEKDIEMPYNITRDELVHMAKRTKKVMKFNKKFYKNQESRKRKILIEKSFKENDKGFSKGKKVECFNCGGMGHFAIDCLSLKDIKKSM